MPRRSIVSDDEGTEINLSPMIDCIFILLIFFIVTTVFVQEEGIQVAKPDAAASASLEKTENVVLQVTADDEIRFGDRRLDLAEVPEVVRESMVDAETPVVIRTNAKADNGVFVSVWDAARRGGAVALSFNTVD